MEDKNPPIGLRPSAIWYDQVSALRADEITQAIVRYFQVRKEVPEEWLEEYNNIIKRLNNDKNTTR